MAPGRLLQNGRRRAEPSSASGSSARNAAVSDELPPYEQPSQPLNDAARRALAQISNNRSTRKYDQHLKRSTELIRDAVAAINDRAFENHAVLQQQLGKLAQSPEDKPEDVVDLEAYVTRYGEDVSTVTSHLESALRDIIDYRVELEDEPTVLGMVNGELASQAVDYQAAQQSRKIKKNEPRQPTDGDADQTMADADNTAQDEGEDEEEQLEAEHRPLTGVNEVLEQVRQAKADEWTGMDMGQRYASNNDYILFKKTLHDAQHPNEDVHLPHASAWFGPDGQPVLSKVGEADVAADEDEDAELQIAGEVRTFRCPLTMQVMKDPYSSDKCKHSFEKEAITEYLRSGGGTQTCPQAGCNQMLTLKDLHPDTILQRKIRRMQEAEAQGDDEDEDAEDVGDERDTVVMSSRPVKTENRRGRNIVEDIEDDE